MTKKFYQHSVELDHWENTKIVRVSPEGEEQWTFTHKPNRMMIVPCDLLMACLTRARRVLNLLRQEDPKSPPEIELDGELEPTDLLILLLLQHVNGSRSPQDSFFGWDSRLVGMPQKYYEERIDFLIRNGLVAAREVELPRKPKQELEYTVEYKPLQQEACDFHLKRYNELNRETTSV